MSELTVRQEIVFAQVTSDVTISSTNVAAQTNIVSLPSFTYRAVPYVFRFSFFLFQSTNTNTNLIFSLWEDSTNVGRIFEQNFWHAATFFHGGTFTYRLTPTAGARVFSVKGYRIGGANAVILAGPTRTSDGLMPIQLSAYQVK